MKDISQELLKIAQKLAAIRDPEKEREAREQERKDPFIQGLRERMDQKYKVLRERMKQHPKQHDVLYRVEPALADYVRVILWSSVDDEGEPLDERFNGLHDFSDEAQNELKKDLKAFLNWVSSRFPESDFDTSQLVHDFWLTRNGHGTGFWDNKGKGYSDDEAKTLTEMAKKFGEQHVYEGDDNKLHLF